MSKMVPFGRRNQSGLTLVELLIAVALTLIIIAAMIRAFRSSSDSITEGRARMDMQNNVRTVVSLLRRDLQNATHIATPIETNDGFLEIVEGEETDGEHFDPMESFIGDHDDVFGLTVRSPDEPFRGRWVNDQGTATTDDDTVETIESFLAEVYWWIVHVDTNGDGEVSIDESVRLYRRAFLIRPDLNSNARYSNSDVLQFFEENDVSARPNAASGRMIYNNLQDLANRANRYAHDQSAFPFELRTDWLQARTLGEVNDAVNSFDAVADVNRLGDDLLLDNCVAMDIRVFDPTAEVFTPTSAGLTEGQTVDFDDPGFAAVVAAFPPATNPDSYPQAGAYVNLGYDPGDSLGLGNDRWFAQNPFANNYTWNNNTYCTWWAGYESDGVDQDGDGLLDEGTDGVDNDNANGIDDNLERETRPPYGFPLRSIEIRLRIIEKNTNQILQRSVRESFVPN